MNSILSQLQGSNAQQVNVFIRSQLMDDEFILDSLASELENAGSAATPDMNELDAVLANDVLALTELNALYEVGTLTNNGTPTPAATS